MPAIRVPGDSTYPPRNVVGATLRVLKTSYRCPSSTQARVSTLHGCYKPALVPRDRSLHIARRAVAPGAEPPAGALARPLRPSTTDSASIPAAHVHGRPRAPRPASHAPVRRRGEFFFRSREVVAARRREIAVSINAARCAIKAQVCENETPPSVASFAPLAARQGVSKELGPMFSPFSAPRRSFSTKERPRSRF